MRKAQQASSAEELFMLAKENNLSLTEEQAKEYFTKLQPPMGELPDDELDAVSGGGCSSLSAPQSVIVRGRALDWNCPVCHNDCWEESYRTTASQKWWYCCVCAKENPSNVPYVNQPGQRSSFPSVSVIIRKG